MIRRLVGVYQDGTARALGTPATGVAQLSLPLGASLTVQLRVVNPGGVPIALAGSTLVLTGRRGFAYPAQFTPAAIAAAAAASCACHGAGVGCSSRSCGAPRYGSAALPAPGPDFQISGTLAPSDGPNRADFVMVPATTKLLTPGRYAYDIWLTDAAGLRNAVVPVSPFILEPSVTFPP